MDRGNRSGSAVTSVSPARRVVLRRSKAPAKPKQDEALVARVRRLLSPIRGVEEKRMFGSTAFLVGGKLCVSARAERIMCRIAAERHDAAIARPGCQTVVMRGRSYRGYVYVAADAVTSARALKYWVTLALNHNLARGKRARPT